jgi:hypothetical protein
VGVIQRGMNSTERETGKRATESWERAQRDEGEAEMERAVSIMDIEKAAWLVHLTLTYASPDQAAAKPMGSNTTTEITYIQLTPPTYLKLFAALSISVFDYIT